MGLRASLRYSPSARMRFLLRSSIVDEDLSLTSGATGATAGGALCLRGRKGSRRGTVSRGREISGLLRCVACAVGVVGGMEPSGEPCILNEVL